MNINDIKAQVGQAHLLLVRQPDAKTGENSEWVAHWDNTNRVRIVMHQDVADKIKSDPTFAGLALKSETVSEHLDKDGKKIAAYIRYVVITPANIDYTF